MRKAKTYPNVIKRIYHPEIRSCLTCGTRLRRYATIMSQEVV